MRETVKIHVDYYFACNFAEQEFLMGLFKKSEDSELTMLAEPIGRN